MMDGQAQRYPLAWPIGWRRHDPMRRRRAPFRGAGIAVTVTVALDRLDAQLRLLGATDVILSTNVPLGLRGMPLSQQAEPRDPGVALYFRFKDKPHSLACDRWNRVADNITAIAWHIDALRRIDRYGVGDIEQAFAGYKALTTGRRSWWEVLGFSGPGATGDQIEARYRKLAKERHPDVGGGDAEAFKELAAAKDEALSEATA